MESIFSQIKLHVTKGNLERQSICSTNVSISMHFLVPTFALRQPEYAQIDHRVSLQIFSALKNGFPMLIALASASDRRGSRRTLALLTPDSDAPKLMHDVNEDRVINA